MTIISSENFGDITIMYRAIPFVIENKKGVDNLLQSI